MWNAIANWSIIPQFTPLKLFSENWPISARSWFVTSKPKKSFKINPVNTSTDAEEDNPEPFGIFPFRRRSMPHGISYPFSPNAHITKDEVRKRRAKHAVYENQRTVKAVEALKANDVEQFGKLMNASHVSLLYYPVSSQTSTFISIFIKQPGRRRSLLHRNLPHTRAARRKS